MHGDENPCAGARAGRVAPPSRRFSRAACARAASHVASHDRTPVVIDAPPLGLRAASANGPVLGVSERGGGSIGRQSSSTPISHERRGFLEFAESRPSRSPRRIVSSPISIVAHRASQSRRRWIENAAGPDAKKWGMDRRALANVARRADESYLRDSIPPCVTVGWDRTDCPGGRLETLTATGEAST